MCPSVLNLWCDVAYAATKNNCHSLLLLRHVLNSVSASVEKENGACNIVNIFKQGAVFQYVVVDEVVGLVLLHILR